MRVFVVFLVACGGPTEGPPLCVRDADCVDANPCDGDESCVDGVCEEGAVVACAEAGEVCRVEAGAAVCDVWCDLPRPANVSMLAEDELLTFGGPGTIETAVIEAGEALESAVFATEATVGPFEAGQRVRVLARTDAEGCTEDDRFDLVYAIAEDYPGPAGGPTSEAVAIDDPRIVGWAEAVHLWEVGADLTEAWMEPSRALGEADGTAGGVLSLGRGGAVVVALDGPVADGEGPELAVFENGFQDDFLELGRVSVSTDGVHFASFDGAARTPEPVGPFDLVEPMAVHGFAGVYRQGFGAPFDLSRLRFDEAVRLGFVRLDEIRYVRIDDVVGDGTEVDAWGRPIHDPFPTVGSAGFDLDAVARLR